MEIHLSNEKRLICYQIYLIDFESHNEDLSFHSSQIIEKVWALLAHHADAQSPKLGVLHPSPQETASNSKTKRLVSSYIQIKIVNVKSVTVHPNLYHNLIQSPSMNMLENRLGTPSVRLWAKTLAQRQESLMD